VIGDMADLRTMTRDDLYAHYRKFYLPSNAVLAVAGDFSAEAMLGQVRELFEAVPSGAPPNRLTRPEPAQTGEVRLNVEGPGETAYLQVAYRVPAAADADFFALSVLDSLLAGPSNLNMFGGGISNKTSRLYRALVDAEYAVNISGGSSATIDPYLYTFTLTVHPSRKPEETLLALDTELQKIQADMVSEQEVARAIKQARALFAYGSENISNQAFWLGYPEMFATYEWFLTYLDRLAVVSREDVQRVAGTYFRPQSRVVGTYLPTGQEG
jgi:zinc protease